MEFVRQRDFHEMPHFLLRPYLKKLNWFISYFLAFFFVFRKFTVLPIKSDFYSNWNVFYEILLKYSNFVSFFFYSFTVVSHHGTRIFHETQKEAAQLTFLFFLFISPHLFHYLIHFLFATVFQFFSLLFSRSRLPVTAGTLNYHVAWTSSTHRNTFYGSVGILLYYIFIHAHFSVMVLRQNDPQIARPGQRSTTVVRAKGGSSDEIDVVLSSYIKIHSHAQVAHTL